MSDTSNVLKAPAGGRYERGWCEPDPQGPKQCIDKSIRVSQKPSKRPARNDRFVRGLNPPISEEIQRKMRDPKFRARQVAQLRAATKKPAWYEEVASNLMSAERWKALPENMLKAAAIPFAVFGAGCTFDTSGSAPPDGTVQPDVARHDAGDAEVTDDGALDGATDGTTPVDGSPDTGVDAEVDATVPLGEPPRITWPKIAQLTGNVHMNNRMFWRIKLPLTSPAGKQIVGAEIDRSRNGSFVETIPVVLGHLRGSFDATQPFSSYELAARVIYDDATTSDSTTLTVNVDNSLAFRLDMNENQGTTLHDSSVNAHDATMVGGVNWIQDSTGTGIALAGAGYATFGDASSSHLNFDWNQPFTIVAHVNRASDNVYHSIYSRADLDSSTFRGVGFNIDDANQLLLCVNNDVSAGYYLCADTAFSYSITNMPILASAAYSGSGLVSGVTFSVDGVAEPANVVSDNLDGRTSSVAVSSMVGASMVAGSPSSGFDGSMYYLTIFKRFLATADQRHENCAYLDSIDATLPAYCD